MEDSEQLEGEFRDLKTKISSCYRGENYKWLRCCLYGIVPGAELDRATVGARLFNVLHTNGKISPTDVTLLFEITELTDVKAATVCINKYKHKNNLHDAKEKMLTPYRRGLFKVLRGAGKDELENVVSNYPDLMPFNFKDFWDAVLQLERSRLLEDEPKKIETFLNLLEETTKKLFLDEYGPLPETPASPVAPVNQKAQRGASSGASVSSAAQVIQKGQGDDGLSSGVSRSPVTRVVYQVKSDDELNDLLYDVADTWKDGNVNRLKVILCEFTKLDKAVVESNNDPYKLLELLTVPNIINKSNVNVLIEAAYLGDIQSVEPKITKKVPLFLGFENFVVNEFSRHRQNVIKFGKQLGVTETTNIAHLYNIKNPANQWDLIFKLEKKDKLTEKTKEAFIEKLTEKNMEVVAKVLDA